MALETLAGAGTGATLRGAFISWAKLRRADTIAGKLGIPSHAVLHLRRGKPPLLTVWRYFIQGIGTFLLLLRERPRVVFVTSPPVFAIVPVYLYTLIFRASYVIDSHSGCFLDAHWRRWDRLQSFFARRAALNLVHNAHNAAALERWTARFTVLPSLPPLLPTQGGSPTPRERPHVVYICSFKDDEPVDALLESARAVAGADFFITGRAPEKIRGRLPPNVQLTGFLGEDEYNRLLAAADVLVALTTRAGTLLYGAQEAIALGKPLVVSRTPTLEAYFPDGTVFAENTPGALAAAIGEALARKGELSAAMARFRERYRAEGEARIAELRRRLDPSGTPG